VETRDYRAEGLYFEDFHVGDRMQSPARTVTEADVVNFSGLSGDWHEAHSDAEATKHGLFGQRVAHGLLGLSMASGLASRLPVMAGTVQSFIGVDWRFKRPIYLGDTIRVSAEITRKKPAKALGGGYIVLQVAILNQRDEVVQQGRWIVLFKGRPDSAN
jgi:3-hydroxybutyryl-CoA dehydratase